MTAAGTAGRGGAEERRPVPGRAHAELTETRTGWTLTITVPAHHLEALRAELAGRNRRSIVTGGLILTVEPNLVPGEPFTVGRVEVIVEDDERRRPD